jgi:spermidine synthase
MNDGGMLIQQIPLSYITPISFTGILSSLTSVFSYVSLYQTGNYGIFVATKHGQSASLRPMAGLIKEHPELVRSIQKMGLPISEPSAQLILSTAETARLVKTFQATRDYLAPDDDNLYLDYALPKGNALDAVQSKNQLQEFLTQFSVTLKNK